MLKKNKKRSNLSKILNKKFKNLSLLHEKLSQNGIKYEITVTKEREWWYLLRENNTNYACKLCTDNKKRVYLTQ